MKINDLPQEELIYGSNACAGCGGILAARMALKVLGKNTVIVTSPSCFLGVTSFYPQLALGVPCVNTVFAATGATVSGVVAGLKRKGAEKVNVLAVVGDGGTYDIGLQSLSGAMEREDNFIYLCYDNEAYMNTGVQRSGATPLGARTTTTPAGNIAQGEDRPKKDMMKIVAAHNVSYAASASISYYSDYMGKIRKAMEYQGPKYLQVLAPCPPGWGFGSDKTVEIARLAVRTGMWKLMEYENGEFSIKRQANRKPISEYFAAQSRFSHLSAEDTEKYQQALDAEWAESYEPSYCQRR